LSYTRFVSLQLSTLCRVRLRLSVVSNRVIWVDLWHDTCISVQ